VTVHSHTVKGCMGFCFLSVSPQGKAVRQRRQAWPHSSFPVSAPSLHSSLLFSSLLFSGLRLELRAYTLSHSTSLFFVIFF
jgi:hypothetical protein